jgi:general secretion pathway protein A
MFKEFYGFSEDLFALEPNPRFFFLTENHKKVLLHLVYGITEAKGFTLLLGETGTGKTTFILHLLSMLGLHIKAIPIFDPPKTFDDLLGVILRELKLPLQEGNGKSRLWQLNEYLYQRSAQNETLLIIVDEAQNLSKELLEQLRLLCSPDPIRPRFLQGFLVGQPDIAYSGPFRPLIPADSGHPFRSIPAGHSDGFRPPIPEHSGHPLWGK